MAKNNNWKKKKLASLTQNLKKSYERKKGINHIDGLNIPTADSIVDIIEDFFRIIFPGFTGNEDVRGRKRSCLLGKKQT